jgi:hypothetical protein
MVTGVLVEVPHAFVTTAKYVVMAIGDTSYELEVAPGMRSDEPAPGVPVYHWIVRGVEPAGTMKRVVESPVMMDVEPDCEEIDGGTQAGVTVTVIGVLVASPQSLVTVAEYVVVDVGEALYVAPFAPPMAVAPAYH